VIKRVLLLLAVMLQALPVMAAAPDYPATIVKVYWNGNSDKFSNDPAEACTKLTTATFVTSFTYINSVLNGLKTHSSNWKCSYTSGSTTGTLSHTASFSCPYGGTVHWSGGMCTGVPDGGGPPPENPCGDKNPIIRRYNYGPTGPYISPDNFAGCKVTPVSMNACYKTSTGSFCYWTVVRTGEPYTGPDNGATGGGSTDQNPPPPNLPPPVASPPITPPPAKPEMCSTCRPCPAGTVQAGIGPDGVPMCVGTGTNPPPPPSTPTTTTNPPIKTTAPDGTTTTTQTTQQPNKDGSTTTTTTTTTVKPDGTTTVTRDSAVSNSTAGTPGSTDKPGDDDKYNLCKQNPNLSICRESSVQGTCGQISCTGDAIQCATLRAAAAMECKQRTDDDALKALPAYAKGLAAANGNDPEASTLPSVKNASVVDMQKMEASGWIGGGQAFKDVSFSVQGHSVTVPLNEWSSYLVGLRYALMVVAMLVSFRMLSGVILRD